MAFSISGILTQAMIERRWASRRNRTGFVSEGSGHCLPAITLSRLLECQNVAQQYNLDAYESNLVNVLGRKALLAVSYYLAFVSTF
jgi:hypothetical protein